ncbi:MAG: patatin-like phospholipase family protein [Crocosphaera sp.]|nr:patatin-like phospholipase family protein [Crocosphaera sp.]
MSNLQSVLSFDGKDDYVEIPYQPSLNQTKFTISCWVKVTGRRGQWRSPITSRRDSPQGGYILYGGTNDKWQFWIGDGKIWVNLMGPDIKLRAWTHLAATYDGKQMRFYVNGETVGSPKQSTFNLNQRFPLRIGAGRTEGKPGYFFQGQIAEVRVWEQVRSQAEIKQGMNYRLQGNEPGLVGYWPLNEGSGTTIADRTGNAQNSKIMGATWKEVAIPLQPSPVPVADNSSQPLSDHQMTPSSVVEFNGEDNYLEIPNCPNPTQSITVSCWAKSDTPTWNAIGCLVSKRNAFILHPNGSLGNQKTIQFFIFSGGWKAAIFEPNIDITQWHQYTGTFDGKSIRLYIDGEEVAKTDYSGEINLDDGSLFIGWDDGRSGRYFDGQIGEVCLWNYGRSQPEINGDMHQRLQGNEQGLIGYWPLNDGTGKTIKDHSNHGNDGTLVGAVWKEVDIPLLNTQTQETAGLDNVTETETNETQETAGLDNVTDTETTLPTDETAGSDNVTETETNETQETTSLDNVTETKQQSSSTSIQQQPQTSMTNKTTPKYKILSIDGGGIRGIIPAILLAEIEKRTQKPIHTLFDLMAGTSTGGLLALGLVKPDPDASEPKAEYTAEELIAMYVDYGGVIFYESFLEQLLGPVEDIFAQPKYSPEGRDEVVTKFFGDTPLQNCLKEVFVTSYDIEQRIPVFFTSKLEKQQTESRQFRKLCQGFTLKDAGMATSAAPTFFPPYHVPTSHNTNGFYTLIDGGMVANNPTSLAIMEAELTERKKGHELSKNDILVASLGTGSLTTPYKYADVRNWGVLQWVQPILNIILDGGSELVAGQLERLLEPAGVENPGLYYRFQTFLTTELEAMDQTTPENIKGLQALAYRLIEEKTEEIDLLCEDLTS